MLRYVPDHLKAQEMCDKAVMEDRYSLECVPDWFVTQQQIKLWDDGAQTMKNARPRKQE